MRKTHPDDIKRRRQEISKANQERRALQLAAPDLLAACEAALAYIEVKYPSASFAPDLRAAIAKARGEA